MSVKRYYLDGNDPATLAGCTVILASDYDALLAENERLAARLEGTGSTWKELYESSQAMLAKADAENERMREALRKFVAACDSAPPLEFISHISAAATNARAALAGKP